MATTSIWAIKERLDHVIDYTTNPSKTSKEAYSELHKVIEYAKASYKTEEQLYVTAINCDKDSIHEDMMRTKRRYSKTNGILGFHAFQSFAKGEVTPEIAHEVGVKLANELWGDRFEVVVTTHINTNHIHNHFCLNSVSYKDGKKYYNNRHTYAVMRETSDRLCEEYKLSVIQEKPCGKHNIDYTKYYKEQVNKSNHHTIAKEDIDYAIGQAYSYKDFLSILNKMDYTVENRYGKLSVRKEPYKKNIRIERAFGDDYKIENIEKRIYETQAIREPFPEARAKPKRYRVVKKQNLKNRKKAKGIKALYLHYCFLLKVYPKNKKMKKQYSKELREEIKKMDKISKEARILCRKNIQSAQELLAYKKSLILDRKENKAKVESLWKKNRKVANESEKQKNYEEIKVLQNEIKKLNEEIDLIEDIETRTPKIKETIDEAENRNQDKEKEKENSEYIK
ncbi:MAG: relaxase/mobilization nuclease domain-containing protein [Clostridia bacterium]|nr:relaxase/mobilization nuclease domain-containing protein [Clostridia bacterium]